MGLEVEPELSESAKVPCQPECGGGGYGPLATHDVVDAGWVHPIPLASLYALTPTGSMNSLTPLARVSK